MRTAYSTIVTPAHTTRNRGQIPVAFGVPRVGTGVLAVSAAA